MYTHGTLTVTLMHHINSMSRFLTYREQLNTIDKHSLAYKFTQYCRYLTRTNGGAISGMQAAMGSLLRKHDAKHPPYA